MPVNCVVYMPMSLPVTMLFVTEIVGTGTCPEIGSKSRMPADCVVGSADPHRSSSGRIGCR